MAVEDRVDEPARGHAIAGAVDGLDAGRRERVGSRGELEVERVVESRCVTSTIASASTSKGSPPCALRRRTAPGTISSGVTSLRISTPAAYSCARRRGPSSVQVHHAATVSDGVAIVDLVTLPREAQREARAQVVALDVDHDDARAAARACRRA